MSGKDSREGADKPEVDLAATRPPQRDGQGSASVPADGESEVLSIAPTDIASDAFNPAELPTDLPISVAETVNDGPLPIDGSQAEEPVSVAGSPAELLQHKEIIDVDSLPGEARDPDAPPPAEGEGTGAPDAGPWDLHIGQALEDVAANTPEPAAIASDTAVDAAAPPYSPVAAEVPVAEPDANAEAPSVAVAETVPADPFLRPTDERQAPASEPAPSWPVTPDGERPPDQSTAPTYSAEAPSAQLETRRQRPLRLIKSGARYVAIGAAGYLAFVVLQILAYRIVDPPGSTLMLLRLLGGTEIDRTWVPIERISPNLIRAVIVSEDGRFCDHWGIDLEAMKEAIRRSGDAMPRGASTISMQVTKNLFLWPSKSYLRKIIELPLTVLIELVWPKRRILEIYLNIAEWGPGIFGAEAAARHHFRKPAARLGEREAALLAASLPNPVRRDAGDPGPATSRKARVVQARMHISGPVAGCVTGNR